MNISEKLIRQQLVDYAKSVTSHRWLDIEKNLSVQVPTLNQKKSGFSAALPYGLAVSLVVIAAIVVTNRMPNFYSQDGGHLIAQNEQNSSLPTESSNEDSTNVNEPAISVTTSVTTGVMTGGGISNEVCIVPFRKYKHGIYRLIDTITAKDVALGEKLPDSSYPYHAVKGVDPSVEFAIELNSCTLLYHYVMDDTFTWNGAVYRIDEPSSHTGEQGDKIGTVNGHTIYSIQGCDPSQRIRFQFEKALYTDAVRQ